MEFAKKQLEKYGWTDGKGLGKNENGISEAIKPKLKRSVAGVGHDAASDFTEHWWSALYDKAAKSVKVEDKNGKTKKIKTKSDDVFEISNNMWKLKRKKKASDQNVDDQYTDFFIKKAILNSGGVQTEKIEDSDSEEDDSKPNDLLQLTDEQLFIACKGRTAHKGARHGLKALGKLARIEQQEKLLIQNSKYEGYSSHTKNEKSSNNKILQMDVEDTNLNSDSEDRSHLKQKKKKKKRCVDSLKVEDLNFEKAKSSKSCNKNIGCDTDNQNNIDDKFQEVEGPKSKKCKNEDNNEIVCKRKSKKKKKAKDE